MKLTTEQIENFQEKGYFFRGIIGEFSIEENSKEDASYFDDVLYAANSFCGEDGYSFDIDNLDEYFNSQGLPYKAIDDQNGQWFASFGVNCCVEYNTVFQTECCPNATKIVVFKGNCLGDNIAADGIICSISELIGVYEA